MYICTYVYIVRVHSRIFGMHMHVDVEEETTRVQADKRLAVSLSLPLPQIQPPKKNIFFLSKLCRVYFASLEAEYVRVCSNPISI